MYYTLVGIIAPVFIIGARSASKEGTAKGHFTALVWYLLVLLIYIIGLFF